MEHVEAAMSMQPDVPSKSSSSGSPHSGSESEGVLNTAQSINSHSTNSPNTAFNGEAGSLERLSAFNGEAGSLERLSRDQLEDLKRCNIGHLVRVKFKSGASSCGILDAADVEKDEIIIKVASTLLEAMSRGHSKKTVIPADEITLVTDLEHVYVSASSGEDGRLSRYQLENLKRCNIGHRVRVQFKSGSSCLGILDAADVDKDEIILKVASTLEEAMSRVYSKTKIIPADEILLLSVLDHVNEREGVLNKAQSLNSHPQNSPNTAFNGEAESLERPSRDQLEDLKSGSSSCGILDAADVTKDEILIKMASTPQEAMSKEHSKTETIMQVEDLDRGLLLNENDEMLGAFSSAGWGDPMIIGRCSWEEQQYPRENTNVDNDCHIDIPTFSYGPNLFYLQGLPEPILGEVVGLVGQTAVGKTTAIKLLAGIFKPNLGQENPEWQEILNHFSSWSHIRNFLTGVKESELRVVIKPQNLETLRESEIDNVGGMLACENQRDKERFLEVCNVLDLNDKVKNCSIKELSDGELQRVAIARTILNDVEVYIFDEPSTFLDVIEKHKAAQAIRSVSPNRYVFVVEHDLCVLDYMADKFCCFGGTPGVYGEVLRPINIRDFLSGDIPRNHFHENTQDGQLEMRPTYKYKQTTTSFGDFEMTLMEGTFTNSQVLVVIGNTQTGKFLEMLEGAALSNFEVSYKLQSNDLKDECTVQQLLDVNIHEAQLVSDVVRLLQIEKLYDKKVCNLSNGEKQRVAITLCLGKPADIYLIDEPSVHLDFEQRFLASKAIKSFIVQAEKTAFIVEHDLMMATYMADRVIVVEGESAVKCTAHTPQLLHSGMNLFLSHLNIITVRRDPSTLAPMINKPGSEEDKQQKEEGEYFRG